MKGAIRFEVTVKAVVEMVEKCGKEWKPVSTEPNAAYAYTPEIDKTVQREIEIYNQKVDSLDLPALVSVVNGLGV